MDRLSYPSETLLAGAPRLSLFHWGCVVEHMQSAIDDWFRMGAVVCSPIRRMEGRIYDARERRFETEINEIAFLRLGGKAGVIELISPAGLAGTSLQQRFLAARPGLTHLAYWCDSLPETAAFYFRQGAELVLVAPAARFSENPPATVDIEDLLSDSPACYLRLASGQMIELNPVANHSAMRTQWGESIFDIVPPPDLLRR